MREFRIIAPADCIVSNAAADNDQALRQIESVLEGDVSASDLLRFRPKRGSRPRQAR
jgi:hypothetical protein